MTELFEALCAFQGEVGTITKDRTAKVKTRGGAEYSYSYAGLDTVVETIRPLLAKHDLVWTTLPGLNEQGQPILLYRLLHAKTGDALAGEMPLLMGDTMDAQALGSAITYARRYAMQSVLNLVTDDDDDGRAATEHQRSTPAGASAPSSQEPIEPSTPQRQLINALLKEKSPTAQQLALILDRIGADPNILNVEHWTGHLTGGREGTASRLITFLKEQPIPTGESDVPGAAPGEFKHPEAASPAFDQGEFDEAGATSDES